MQQGPADATTWRPSRRNPRVLQSEQPCVSFRVSERGEAGVVTIDILVGQPEAVPLRPGAGALVDWVEALGSLILDDTFDLFGTKCRFDVLPAGEQGPPQLRVVAVRSPADLRAPVETGAGEAQVPPSVVDFSTIRASASGAPDLDSVGFFVADCSEDEPGGVYLWFDSVRQMKRYIVSIEPAIALGRLDGDSMERHRDEYKRISTRLARIFAEVSCRADLTPGISGKINKVLGEKRVLWLGTFAGLCGGGSAWCRKARVAFRVTTGRRQHTSESMRLQRDMLGEPLVGKQRASFASFIANYI